jgi:hypothetical protein
MTDGGSLLINSLAVLVRKVVAHAPTGSTIIEIPFFLACAIAFNME